MFLMIRTLQLIIHLAFMKVILPLYFNLTNLIKIISSYH